MDEIDPPKNPEDQASPEPKSAEASSPAATEGNAGASSDGFTPPEGRRLPITRTPRVYKTAEVVRLVRTAERISEQSSDTLKQVPLSLEERMFVDMIVEGFSPGQAMKAIEPEANYSSSEAYNRGRGLMRRANVSDAIVRRFQSEVENGEGRGETGARLRTFISTQLEQIASTSTNDTARIAALEKLGKLYHVSAFEEKQRVVVTNTTSADDIKAEIERRLAKAKG